MRGFKLATLFASRSIQYQKRKKKPKKRRGVRQKVNGAGPRELIDRLSINDRSMDGCYQCSTGFFFYLVEQDGVGETN